MFVVEIIIRSYRKFSKVIAESLAELAEVHRKASGIIIVTVLDLVSQVLDVVLVMCIFSSGKSQGVGILERGVYGEGDGRGEISLRATWDQGGQDPIAARRVPSK
jgi:hypothetical protein